MRVDEYLASSAPSIDDRPGTRGPLSLSDTWSRRLTAAIVVALGYYFGVQVGLVLTFASSPVSTVWPPNAILLAALLLTPPRSWWLPIAAILPAHFAAELSLAVPLTMAACWFVSNVTEALLGAVFILRILGDTPRFDRVRDLAVFLGCGVVLAPVLSSFLDAGFVALVGWRYNGEYWQVWRVRLFSNALAALTVVPLIVIWFRQRGDHLRRITFAECAEMVALLVGVCATSAVVFLQSHPPGASAVLMYAPLPFLMWAAIRRGVGSVGLCVVMVMLFAILGVLAGRGPFASSAPDIAAFNVQAFLIIAASSLMLLAASFAELRRARANEQRHRESLNLALGAAQMGIWDWNIAANRIVWRVDQQGSTTVPAAPLSLAEVLGRIHTDDRAMVRGAIDDAFEKGDTGEVEYRILSAPGEFRWTVSRGKLLTDARGTPQRMIGVSRDITERKFREMQYRMQREQLERLNRVSILGELSGALAHELNQPLAAILSNAQAALLTLQRPAADAHEIAEILADIVSDDKRASEVIRRLRELLMRRAVYRQPVDPNECIKEVLKLQHGSLVERNVLTEVRLAERIPIVMADRVQLQQVLLNLIVNACDAMAGRPPGDRLLRIASAAGADGAVRIEVCDNGRGVGNDPEAIFAPFFSTKNGGIGLGLTICRTIITSHRGRLWASNNATCGATLHIWIPLDCDQPLASSMRRE